MYASWNFCYYFYFCDVDVDVSVVSRLKLRPTLPPRGYAPSLSTVTVTVANIGVTLTFFTQAPKTPSPEKRKWKTNGRKKEEVTHPAHQRFGVQGFTKTKENKTKTRKETEIRLAARSRFQKWHWRGGRGGGGGGWGRVGAIKKNDLKKDLAKQAEKNGNIQFQKIKNKEKLLTAPALSLPFHNRSKTMLGQNSNICVGDRGGGELRSTTQIQKCNNSTPIPTTTTKICVNCYGGIIPNFDSSFQQHKT